METLPAKRQPSHMDLTGRGAVEVHLHYHETPQPPERPYWPSPWPVFLAAITIVASTGVLATFNETLAAVALITMTTVAALGWIIFAELVRRW